MATIAWRTECGQGHTHAADMQLQTILLLYNPAIAYIFTGNRRSIGI